MQLSSCERHADIITRRRGGGVADYRRAVGVPAHGVAASKYSQRAERFESRGGAAQQRIRAVAPLDDGVAQPSVGRHEPRTNRSEATAEIEPVQLTLQLLESSSARREAHAQRPGQRVREFGAMPCPERDSRRHAG